MQHQKQRVEDGLRHLQQVLSTYQVGSGGGESLLRSDCSVPLLCSDGQIGHLPGGQVLLGEGNDAIPHLGWCVSVLVPPGDPLLAKGRKKVQGSNGVRLRHMCAFRATLITRVCLVLHAGPQSSPRL